MSSSEAVFLHLNIPFQSPEPLQQLKDSIEKKGDHQSAAEKIYGLYRLIKGLSVKEERIQQLKIYFPVVRKAYQTHGVRYITCYEKLKKLCIANIIELDTIFPEHIVLFSATKSSYTVCEELLSDIYKDKELYFPLSDKAMQAFCHFVHKRPLDFQKPIAGSRLQLAGKEKYELLEELLLFAKERKIESLRDECCRCQQEIFKGFLNKLKTTEMDERANRDFGNWVNSVLKLIKMVPVLSSALQNVLRKDTTFKDFFHRYAANSFFLNTFNSDALRYIVCDHDLSRLIRALVDGFHIDQKSLTILTNYPKKTIAPFLNNMRLTIHHDDLTQHGHLQLQRHLEDIRSVVGKGHTFKQLVIEIGSNEKFPPMTQLLCKDSLSGVSRLALRLHGSWCLSKNLLQVPELEISWPRGSTVLVDTHQSKIETTEQAAKFFAQATSRKPTVREKEKILTVEFHP